MSKLRFRYKDKEYVLEYTRRTVAETERLGLVVDDLGKKPATMIPLLWRGAFLKNHRNTDRALIDEIWDAMTHRTELINKLAEMYAAPLNALLGGEDEEDDEAKSPNWEMA